MLWNTPTTTNWNPWSDMHQLQQELNRIFGRSSLQGPETGDYPAVNIWTNSEAAVLAAELPGMDPSKLEVTIKDDTLTLRGTRAPLKLENAEEYLRHERGAGNFVRAFTLPFRVEADTVKAEYQKGMLLVTLPRASSDKPKTIAVSAA